MAGFSASELAEMVDGKIIGAADVRVSDVASLESADAGDLAFLRHKKNIATAEASRAGIIVSPAELEQYAGTVIVCEDPEMAMAIVLQTIDRQRTTHPQGISELASVAPTADIGEGAAVGPFAVISDGTVIGENAVIYPHAYIGCNSRIGPRTIVYANVSIHHDVEIGADCVIHYNAAIGGEGFGFIQRDGGHVKLSQVGTVKIGDAVEIGALTTVDRAMLDATIIEDGVKIDNHCHIAHNCRVGRACIMAGYSKLAGSVTLGQGVMIANDSAVKDHVNVGDGAVIAGGSAARKDVPPGAVMYGYPARPIAEERRIWALRGRLPDMAKKLRWLEKKVKELSGDDPEKDRS